MLWNERHPDSKITHKDDYSIWMNLKENLQHVCSTEQCWLRQNFAKHQVGTELTSYTFAPQSPASWKKNPKKWLTSLDIDKVMRQYEKKFPHFVFIGPSPIDFEKNFSTMNAYEKGKFS